MDATEDRRTTRSGVSAMTAANPPRRGRVAVTAAVTALLVAALLPAGTPAERAYLIDAGRVLPAAARILQALPVADALLVSSPVPIPGAAPADAVVTPEALLVEEADGTRLDSGVASTGAPAVWSTTRGDRAVVALIDTGVAAVPALDGAIAGEIDFTGTGGGDGFGHGTFLASVIAGRGPVAPGVAPGAGILSLKVAEPDGTTTLRSVMSALEWLHGPGRSAGIRVAALAMGVEPGTEAAAIVDRAVDRLARAGVLVVTAAGNEGADTLTAPATARGSFSIGAVDDAGTVERGDDEVAHWSGTGVDADGVEQPDAYASGVNVTGSVAHDSVVGRMATPTDDGLYRGTGTSMSTAVAAGVAALVSSARPDLDGAALAAALRAGGRAIDAPAAVAAALAAPARPGASGTAGAYPGNSGANGGARGGADPQSIRWTSIRWTSIRWTGAGWGDEQWGMAAWGSIRWKAGFWESAAPADPQSIRWTSIRWKSIRWALLASDDAAASAPDA